MPSPDIQPYVGLELYDQDPQDIFDICVSEMQLAFPDWEPREGNVEVQLLDAISVAFAEVIFAINRLPDGIFEALLVFFGLERDIGAQPVVQLRFELGDSSGGGLIPEGTTVLLTRTGDEPGEIEFHTVEDIQFPSGATNVVIDAISSEYTSSFNGFPPNSLAQPVDSLASVDFVKTDNNVLGGRDPEEDDDYFTRGTQLLQRLTSALVLPSHFENYALEQPFIERAFGIDNYNPANDSDNNGPVGADPGHMTVAVYGDSAVVSSANKTALLNSFENTSYANLICHVVDPTITSFSITATVKVDPTYDAAIVVSDITQTLYAFYSVMTWNWSNKIRLNELIALISNVEGVDYVTSLTQPSADVNLTGVANLVALSSANISVA